MRIEDHPILGKPLRGPKIKILFDGRPVEAYDGEPIAAALSAAERRIARRWE